MLNENQTQKFISMTGNIDNPYASPSFSTSISASTEVGDDQLAARGQRLVAAIIDTLLLMAVMLPLFIFIQYEGLDLMPPLELPSQVMTEVLTSFLFEVVFLVFHGSLLVSRGQTIGKYLMKIQIVDQSTGALLPFSRVYVYRNLWVLVITVLAVLFVTEQEVSDLIVSLAGTIDVLFIFSASRLCLHDHFAFSKVVLFREGRKKLCHSD